MCWKEIYSAYRKSLPVATETGVGPDYSLIDCVNRVCQQTMKSVYLGQILSLLFFEILA